GSPAHQREHDTPTAERHADDQELRPDDPERRQPEEVAETRQPQDVGPAREPSQRPEERDAEHGVRAVQRRKPEEGADGHDARRRIEMPSSPSQTASAPGYAPRSQPRQTIQRAFGSSRRGSR